MGDRHGDGCIRLGLGIGLLKHPIQLVLDLGPGIGGQGIYHPVHERGGGPVCLVGGGSYGLALDAVKQVVADGGEGLGGRLADDRVGVHRSGGGVGAAGGGLGRDILPIGFEHGVGVLVKTPRGGFRPFRPRQLTFDGVVHRGHQDGDGCLKLLAGVVGVGLTVRIQPDGYIGGVGVTQDQGHLGGKGDVGGHFVGVLIVGGGGGIWALVKFAFQEVVVLADRPGDALGLTELVEGLQLVQCTLRNPGELVVPLGVDVGGGHAHRHTYTVEVELLGLGLVRVGLEPLLGLEQDGPKV